MQGADLVLPTFKYHPDPIATGNIKRSENVCACCGKSRGYIYVPAPYGSQALVDHLCPWCIANGEAAFKFNCFFINERPLVHADLSRAVIVEVTRKTPGYTSWQEQEWQVCCGDACVFHGDASISELAELKGDELRALQQEWPILPARWNELVRQYVPGGGIAVYRFECRHCGKIKYALDLA